MENEEQFHAAINDLKQKSVFQRQCHFLAGRKYYSSQRTGHISIIVLNVLLGSVFLFHMSNQVSFKPVFDWVVPILSFIAALISALFLQFKPDEEFHGHRKYGNLFAGLVSKVGLLEQQYLDTMLDKKDAWSILLALDQEYYQLREQADQYIVTPKIRDKVAKEIS